MNRYQKRALQIGGGLLALSLIFPPFYWKADDSNAQSETSYIFLINWFTGQYSQLAQIDILRFLLQLAIIIVGTVWALYQYRPRRRRY